MPFAIASLAFTVLVCNTMLRVFGTVVLFASRRHIAIAAQIAPIWAPFLGAFQVASIAPLELVFALAAVKAFQPDLVLTSTNVRHRLHCAITPAPSFVACINQK